LIDHLSKAMRSNKDNLFWLCAIGKNTTGLHIHRYEHRCVNTTE